MTMSDDDIDLTLPYVEGIQYNRFVVDIDDLVFSTPMCFLCRHWNGERPGQMHSLW